MISWVPQGKALGQLLFLLMIDNITEVLENEGVKIYIFPDDTRLTKGVKDEEDVEHFKNSLN